MVLTTIINLVLGGLLVAWFLWWRRMAAHLERFREARDEMAGLMQQLQTQLDLVQREMAALSAMARTTVPGMQETLQRSETLLLELRTVAASGERVASRIEQAARLAHAARPAPAAECGAYRDDVDERDGPADEDFVLDHAASSHGPRRRLRGRRPEPLRGFGGEDE